MTHVVVSAAASQAAVLVAASYIVIPATASYVVQIEIAKGGFQVCTLLYPIPHYRTL